METDQKKATTAKKQKSRFAQFHMEHWQIITVYLYLYDMFAVNMAFFMALWLRFDCRYSTIPTNYLHAWLVFVPAYTVCCTIVFTLCRMYRSIWRFASFVELYHVIQATVLTFVFHVIGITVFVQRMPLTYYAFGIVIQFIVLTGVRFAYRFVLLIRSERGIAKEADRVMVIGAGNAGQMLMRDILHEESRQDRVVCFIDDNPNKWHRYINGVSIVGGREDILQSVEKYRVDKIYLAIPTLELSEQKKILDICKESGCKIKALPSLMQIANDEIKVSKLKDVQIEDLLGRKQIHVNLEEIFRELTGKVILVTGGGGSIGSELCRQIAAHHPKQLIIFDIYENNAHAIRLELEDQYPQLNLVTLIGSVRDSRRLEEVFATYHPEIVYHAAAHKHVPLMEESPCEAIKNNVLGTYKTAYAALHHGCERFVLISTDKAVNPTNIMGASKRLCEMVIQTFAARVADGTAMQMPLLQSHGEDAEHVAAHDAEAKGTGQTKFVAVRFGNVLGSNGSVVPRFKEQIAKGGPVTVTHPDIIRYFMTIPEAVSLVLQAGSYARGGEIFVLDMGDPVRIDDMARNMIKLSGLRPDVDIRIEYTGLRPGEKMYEEKLMAEEGLDKTDNELIYIGHPLAFDQGSFLGQLQELIVAAYDEDEAIQHRVEQIVSTYHPA